MYLDGHRGQVGKEAISMSIYSPFLCYVCCISFWDCLFCHIHKIQLLN